MLSYAVLVEERSAGNDYINVLISFLLGDSLIG